MAQKKGYVVDTSVGIKWVIDETSSDQAELLQGTDMVAPALFRIEAGNVLRTLVKKGALPKEFAYDIFLFLQSAPLTIIDADDDLEQRALEMAIELQHPVYDCVYLALAERTSRTLVTADQRFANALTSTKHASIVMTLDQFAAETAGKPPV